MKNTTKKDLAKALDQINPLFNYNVEKGATSYKNYKKEELIQTLAIQKLIHGHSKYTER